MTPDHVVADKPTGKIKQVTIADKTVMTRPAATGTEEGPVEENKRRVQVLTAAQAAELAKLGAAIEQYYGEPQDIEWCLAQGEFYIVQSRPITTLPPAPARWTSPIPGAKWMVVAGRAGGIPLQMQGGAGGFLVDSVEECAERTLWLLRNPEAGQALASRGKELVRERFLLTRLIADELRLYASLLGGRYQAEELVSKVGLTGEARDPVCGMHVDPDRSISSERLGRLHYFCSSACQQLFMADPGRFLRSEAREDSGR